MESPHPARPPYHCKETCQRSTSCPLDVGSRTSQKKRNNRRIYAVVSFFLADFLSLDVIPKDCLIIKNILNAVSQRNKALDSFGIQFGLRLTKNSLSGECQRMKN